MIKRKGLTSKQMSELYKRRARRYADKKAFMEVGIAKKISMRSFNKTLKWLKKGKYKYSDWDGDGKVNKYDCKPLNKYKQDKFNFESLVVSEDKKKEIKEKSTKELKEDIKSEPTTIKQYDKAIKEERKIPDFKRTLKEVEEKEKKKQKKDFEEIMTAYKKEEKKLKPKVTEVSEIIKGLNKRNDVKKEVNDIINNEIKKSSRFKSKRQTYEEYEKKGAKVPQTYMGKKLSDNMRQLSMGLGRKLTREEIKKLYDDNYNIFRK